MQVAGFVLPVTSLASFALMYILILYLLLHLLNLNMNISARSVVINIRGISEKKYGRRYPRNKTIRSVQIFYSKLFTKSGCSFIITLWR